MRWCAGCTESRHCVPAPSTRSSTPPSGPGRWSQTCNTGSISTRCTATKKPTDLALNEIGGSGFAPPSRCSLTSIGEPRNRILHPHRRRHQRHRWRRHHHRNGAMTENVRWHAGAVSQAQRHSVTGGPGMTYGLLVCLAAANRLLRPGPSGRSFERAVRRTPSMATMSDMASMPTLDSRRDRKENVRRVGEVARLMADAGLWCWRL